MGVDTNAGPGDATHDEADLDAFVDQMRAAVGRLQDDAAIALELNPESQALDDVHLVRNVLVVYAERIMIFDTSIRRVIEQLRDGDAWSPERIAATRSALIEHLAHVVDDLGDETPNEVIMVGIEARERERGG